MREEWRLTLKGLQENIESKFNVVKNGELRDSSGKFVWHIFSKSSVILIFRLKISNNSKRT